MADLAQIKLNNSLYNIKDSTARSLLGGHSVGKDVPSNAVFTDTTYSLSISGNRITLTPSSGQAVYIDLPIYDGSVQNGGSS